MSRPTLLLLTAAVLASVLISSCEARRRRGPILDKKEAEAGDSRKGKLISLFNIVTFENSPCASTATTGSGNNRNGTCFTASECTDKRGTHSGNCAAGFGVCCVFTVENDGDVINQNCSYIRNPGFPSTYSGTATSFRNTINKCRCDICHIRLDFEAFSIQGPADTLEQGGGTCVDTFTVSTTTGQNVPTICGINSGKHMYIDVGGGCSDSITVATQFSGASTTRRWDIKATQIECSAKLRPPAGCLEYLTTGVGRITSFNFDNTAGTHLASQEHKICVRSTQASCCIRYTLCPDANSFSLFNDIALADPDVSVSMIDTECSQDYIEAQDFSPDCVPNAGSARRYRLCGGKLNTTPALTLNLEAVCDCNPDFSILIKTDADTDDGTAASIDNVYDRSRGVCLDYSLVNC